MSLRVPALAAAVLLLLPTQSRAQTVVDFDDLPGAIGTIPDGYGGVDWPDGAGSPSPSFGLDWWYWDPSGNSAFLPHSGSHVAFSYADAAPIVLGVPTTFGGAYLTGRSSMTYFRLYLGGSLVHTSSSLALAATPTFLDAGYSGLVDKVEVVGARGNWAIDDVTFGTSVVPEPATFLLLATGLLGVAVLARRRTSPLDETT